MRNIFNINIVTSFVILILLLLRLFGFKFFPETWVYYVYFPLLLLLSRYNVKSGYAKLILLYIVLLTFSCLYSHFFNGQKLLTTIIHSFSYFSIIFFFVLLQFKPSYKEMEKIMVIVSFYFCVCYLIQWIIYPTVLFGAAGRNTGEDMFRARLPGSISCYFLLMYGINKLIQHRKPKYALLAIIGFLPIIIMGFRSLIALTFFSAFVMIPFVIRSGRKTVLYSLLGAGIVIMAMQTPLVQSKIEEMHRRQEADQTFENKDYVRYISLDYYWNYYFTKPYEKIIGGGPPADESSKYARRIKKMNDNHLWIEDLGMVGLSMMIGIPAAICLVLIYLICIFRCKSPDLQYIRFTLLIVLLGSIFTSMELYRTGNILLLSLLVYMEMKYNRELMLRKYKICANERNRTKRLLRLYGMRKYMHSLCDNNET